MRRLKPHRIVFNQFYAPTAIVIAGSNTNPPSSVGYATGLIQQVASPLFVVLFFFFFFYFFLFFFFAFGLFLFYPELGGGTDDSNWDCINKALGDPLGSIFIQILSGPLRLHSRGSALCYYD